jgi:hypothetical protein
MVIATSANEKGTTGKEPFRTALLPAGSLKNSLAEKLSMTKLRAIKKAKSEDFAFPVLHLQSD